MRKLIEQPTFDNTPQGEAGKSHKHESAERQVSGQARYIDDMPEAANIHHVAVGVSPVTRGTITAIDLSDVKASEGVIDVITVNDIPGHTDIGAVFPGDPLLAGSEILYHSQPIFAVLASSVNFARQAVLKANIVISPTEPCLSIAQAKQQNNFVRPAHFMRRGDFTKSFAQSPIQIEGEMIIGGQEHMYLEGQVSMAIPEEEDRMLVYSSSQHPSEVQKLIAEVLDIKLHKVVVDMRRMGGGFGGKETQAAQWACLAALFASRNKVAVKLRLPRMLDMMATGKRHPFDNKFKVATDHQGLIQATHIEINGNCGHSPDLSDAIVDRAMFHADNGYYLADCYIEGHRCRTNQVSHTAYRAFWWPPRHDCCRSHDGRYCA